MKETTKLKNWQALRDHRAALKNTSLKALFAADPARFGKLSLGLPGILVDLSKNIINAETLALLVGLAEDAGLEAARTEMFRGGKINTTESRAVLHTALRAPKGKAVNVDGRNVVTEVHAVLDVMRKFTDAVRGGGWRGHSGDEITDIVNIGIGGSSLGPQLVTQALAPYHHKRLTAHFVANVEASDLARTLEKLSPETTLFIVASKTFTTAETMQNAHIAREWLLSHYKDDAAVARHFVAASTNAPEVAKFGIAPENMFPFWDWVGGRYSVWSAIGLSVMLMIGADRFAEFLGGGHEMDEHFRTTPFEKNIPALLGLIGVWYRNFLDFPAYAVIPYNACLGRLSAFLQQLDMESNGKGVTREGQPVATATGPMVFGEPGTDSQHSFFQWLHQGTSTVPVDFIAAVKTPYGNADQQTMLLANMLAQSEALMAGKENAAEHHRNFTGNRPSTTILLDELSPRTLGMLIALYEHKVFVQGIVWGINSFDQWGVELGKVLAKTLEAEMKTGAPGAHDASTLGLLNYINVKR
ncbi:MAG TPA: glucose-6-phosphate isomerase [Patescibacteria group bacterium]|nr:glucose-6-phosphate isomerase [Patescibacteria group bacterium]